MSGPSSSSSSRHVGAGYAGDFWTTTPSTLEQQRIQWRIENRLIAELETTKVFELGDVFPLLARDGVQKLIDDDFSRCFKENPANDWNWNAYLFPLWAVGVLVRYTVLFPVRFASLVLGAISFALLFGLAKLCLRGETRAVVERRLIRFLCGVFVFSWCGVIKYHGVIPAKRANQVYVANHSSMIDAIILEQEHTFALVGQKHKGWLAFVQDHVIDCLGCVWLERGDEKNRKAAADAIRSHVNTPGANRLLVFPEGTCVNNNYIVQFKRAVFGMGCTICPIAIKYNKIFVDGYWNSRAISFFGHLCRLMLSWAVVCDVYYLPPVTIRPNETDIEFAARVQGLIAKTAGLKAVDWDGYMKYFLPSQRFVQERQKTFAASMIKRLEGSRKTSGIDRAVIERVLARDAHATHAVCAEALADADAAARPGKLVAPTPLASPASASRSGGPCEGSGANGRVGPVAAPSAGPPSSVTESPDATGEEPGGAVEAEEDDAVAIESEPPAPAPVPLPLPAPAHVANRPRPPALDVADAKRRPPPETPPPAAAAATTSAVNAAVAVGGRPGTTEAYWASVNAAIAGAAGTGASSSSNNSYAGAPALGDAGDDALSLSPSASASSSSSPGVKKRRRFLGGIFSSSSSKKKREEKQ